MNKVMNKQKMKSLNYEVVTKTRLRNKMGIKQTISLYKVMSEKKMKSSKW